MNAMFVIYYVKQKLLVRLVFCKSQHTPTGSETAVTLARIVLFIFLEMNASRLYLYLLNSH